MLSGVEVGWWEMLLVSGFNVAVFDDDELPDKDKDGVLVKLEEREWGDRCWCWCWDLLPRYDC